MTDKFWAWTKTIGSAAASAAFLYYFLPAWIGMFLLAVVIAHEFGHVVIAQMLGADPDPPIFIPFGILVLGISRIREQTPEIGQFIALAGPLCGASMAFTLLIFSLLTWNVPAIIASLWFLGWELFNLTIGSDGKKFRKWRHEFNQTRGSSFTFT